MRAKFIRIVKRLYMTLETDHVFNKFEKKHCRKKKLQQLHK